MKPIVPLALLMALTACPVVAQDNPASRPLTTQPPAGSYQGYLNSPSNPEQQQTAEVPSEPKSKPLHPGTLRKFNSNSGYGPEVEFETERRQQQQQQMQGRTR